MRRRLVMPLSQQAAMARHDELQAMHVSDRHAARTVDSLAAADWSAPSVLPDWSRAHVIAHLALNGAGLARALEGVLAGNRVPMYVSGASRDADIAELAAARPAQIRARFAAATSWFQNVADELTDEHWATGAVLRVPDGPEWPAAEVPVARRREVEIHHADLGLDRYTPHQWPVDFTTTLLDLATANHGASGLTPPFMAYADDLDRTWVIGDHSGGTVRGAAADLVDRVAHLDALEVVPTCR